VEGKTLDLCLKPYLHQAERLFEQLGDLIRSIYQTVPGCGCVFERSKTYTEWFGETDCTGELCLMPANLDLTFSNMIQAQDGTFLAFDYEWIMSVPIPQDFIVFRALHHFYIQYAAILAKTYTLEAFMQQCGIAPEQCHKYEQMEKNMYQKICTGAEAAFSDTFQVPRTSFTTVLYEKQLLKETTDLLHHTQQEYLSAIGRWEQKEEAYASKVQELTLSNETYARQMQELALSNESYVRQIQELALIGQPACYGLPVILLAHDQAGSAGKTGGHLCRGEWDWIYGSVCGAKDQKEAAKTARTSGKNRFSTGSAYRKRSRIAEAEDAAFCCGTKDQYCHTFV